MATKAERKKRNRAKEKKKRYVQFFTPSGEKVTVDLQSNPLVGIYRNGGVTYQQFAAAASFQRDFEAAGYSQMRCRGFEPGVDGGKIAGANLNAVDAQRKLARLRAHLGKEHYMIMEAVIGFGFTFHAIHAAGADENKLLSEKLKAACNKAAVFYQFHAEDPETRTVKALQKILQGLVAEAGEFTT